VCARGSTKLWCKQPAKTTTRGSTGLACHEDGLGVVQWQYGPWVGGGHTQRRRRPRVHTGEDGAQPRPGVAVPMVAMGTRRRRRLLVGGGGGGDGCGRGGGRGVPGALERRVRGETAGAEEGGGGGPGAGPRVRFWVDVTQRGQEGAPETQHRCLDGYGCR